MFYFGKLVQCLFWIIYSVTDQLWLIINIIVIIMFVLNYVIYFFKVIIVMLFKRPVSLKGQKRKIIVL